MFRKNQANWEKVNKREVAYKCQEKPLFIFPWIPYIKKY